VTFPEQGWAPTRALGRAVLLAGLLMLLAVLLGRLDLVVLAAPFALGAGWALILRPTAAPGVRVALAEESVNEGGAVSATIALSNPDEVGYDAVVARVTYAPWLRLRHGDRPYVGALPAGTGTEVSLEGVALRWGIQHFGPGQVFAAAGGGLLVSVPTVSRPTALRVFPVTAPFRADDAMPHAAGLVGVHRSRRTGEGGELAGIRAFAPGDRLRRIDWRTTLRTQQPHVAQALSDRDAEVVLVLDVAQEAGRSGGIGGAASAVDTTVRAATAIAEHYLHRGDRLSLVEYSVGIRRLRPASGRRQFQAVLEWMLHIEPGTEIDTVPIYLLDNHQVSSSALVVVLTPLLNEYSTELVVRLARSGRVVVAIDTLGAARPYTRSSWGQIASRLWWLERENVIGQLREVGVPVVQWAGTGSLDQVLRDVTRLAAAPRVRIH
jgi:uncharacterized protein (DUF58 family)